MRSKTSAALLLVVIFLLGAVAGGMSFYMIRANIGSGAETRPRSPNSHDIAEEMAQSLNLDSRQKEQLRVVIQQSAERYRDLSIQFRPQYEKIRAETNDEIRALLRPDQRAHFEETLQTMDSRHRSHTHDSPPNK